MFDNKKKCRLQSATIKITEYPRLVTLVTEAHIPQCDSLTEKPYNCLFSSIRILTGSILLFQRSC